MIWHTNASEMLAVSKTPWKLKYCAVETTEHCRINRSSIFQKVNMNVHFVRYDQKRRGDCVRHIRQVVFTCVSQPLDGLAKSVHKAACVNIETESNHGF